jgi:hypothetical protein
MRVQSVARQLEAVRSTGSMPIDSTVAERADPRVTSLSTTQKERSSA